MPQHDDANCKRTDAHCFLLDTLYKRVDRLEEQCDETRDVLTQLQISIGNLGEYFKRQEKMETDLAQIHTQITELKGVSASIRRVEVILWGVVTAMIPGIITIIWELSKHWFGK